MSRWEASAKLQDLARSKGPNSRMALMLILGSSAMVGADAAWLPSATDAEICSES